jgi:hypothetical protein
MTAERPKPAEEMGRVVRFTPRASPGNRAAPKDPSPVGHIGQYARGGRDDDYRHRMTMNVLAFIVCLLLAAAGIWLAGRIAEMRKNQDCVLSGRIGCTHVDVPARER